MKEVEEIKVDEIYSGNVTDKTQKIRLGYLMLGTMEEKVDYILKLSALQSIAEMEKKPVSNQEKDMVETLQEELCKEYLTNGDYEDNKKLLEVISREGTKVSLGIFNDYQIQTHLIEEKDPDILDRKAYYIARGEVINSAKLGAIQRLSGTINDKYRHDNKCRTSALQGITVTEKTTMGDLARQLGYKDEDIQEFIKAQGAETPETTVHECVTNKLLQFNPGTKTDTPNFKKTLESEIKDLIVYERSYLISRNVRDELVDAKHFNEDEKKAFAKIEKKNTGELSEKYIGTWIESLPDGRTVEKKSDWIDKEAKPYLKEGAKENVDELYQDFKETYAENTEGVYVLRDLEPGLSNKERNERAKFIYEQLSTYEAKLTFLMDFQADNYACLELGLEKKSEEGMDTFNELIEDFKEKYITNGDNETRKSIIEYLGRQNAKHCAVMYEDKKEVLKQFPQNEKKAEKKANYIVRLSSKGSAYISSLFDLNINLVTDFQNNQNVLNSVLDGLGLNEETTVDDVLNYIGFSTEDLIQGYETQIKGKRGEKIFEVYRRQYKNGETSVDFIKNAIVTDLMPNLVSSWKFVQSNKFLRNMGYKDEDIEEIGKISSLNTGEVSKSGIEDWIKTTGNKIVKERAYKSNIDIRREHKNNYKDWSKEYKDHKQLQEQTNIFKGTDNDKAEKIGEIFDSFTTVEDKLRFLYETYAYHNLRLDVDGKTVSEPEDEMVEKLMNEIEYNYLTNGTPEDHEAVFSALSKIGTEVALKTYYEKNRIAGELEEKDADLKERKSYYLVRNTPSIAAHNSAFQALYSNYLNCVKNNKEFRASYAERVDFNAPKSMVEFLKEIGYTDAEIPAIMQENKISMDASSDEYFIRKNLVDMPGANTESVAFKNRVRQDKRDFFFEQKTRLWSSRAREKALNAAGLNQEEKDAVNKIMSKNQDPPSQRKIGDWVQEVDGQPYNMHNDWVETEGKKYLKDHHDANISNETKSYKEFYIDKLEKRSLKAKAEETYEERSNLSATKAYPKLFDKDKKTGRYEEHDISEEEFEQLMRDVKIDIGDLARNELVDAGMRVITPQLKNRIANAQPNSSREATQLSMFTLWALGTQESVDMTNFERVYENPELLEKYAKFCEENPTVTAATEEQFKKSTKAWTDMFLKATEKVKKFKLPEIDYSNREQLKDHIYSLARLNAMCVDYLQERERTYNNNLGLDGVNIAEEAMGGNKYNETLTFWSQLQSSLAGFNDAYMLPFNAAGSSTAMYSLNDKVFNKEIFEGIFNKHAGKTAEELVQQMGRRKYYGSYETGMYGTITDIEGGPMTGICEGMAPIDRNSIIKFATGRDRKSFEKKYKEVSTTVEKHAIDNLNQLCYMKLTNSVSGIKINDVYDLIKDLPDTAEAAVNFLNDTKIAEGKKYTNSALITKTFSAFFVEDYRNLTAAAGIKPMNAFTIDGKTPEELWGVKYKNVPAGLKERCYQLEMFKCMAKGKHDISAKIIGLGPNDKLRVVGETIVSPSVDRLYELKQNLAVYKSGIKTMIDELETIQDQLLQTHQSTDPKVQRDEIAKVGSKRFRNMEAKLYLAIETLKDKKATPDEIGRKLSDYQKASEEYFKDKAGRSGKVDDKHQTRIDMAEMGKDTAAEFLMTFDNLRAAFDTGILACENGTTKVATEHELDDIIKTYNKENMAGVYKSGATDIPEDGINILAENARAKAQGQLFVKTELAKGIKDLGLDAEKILGGGKLTKPGDAAMGYICDKVIKEISSPNVNTKYLEEIAERVKGHFENGSYKKEVTALSKNPVFRAFIKDNNGFNAKGWEQIERRTDMMVQSMKDSLNEITGGNPNFEYDKYILRKSETQSRPTTERYDLLSDIVAKQILTDPRSRVIVQAVETGKMNYRKDIVKVIKDTFVKQNYLDPNKIDVGSMREALRNGDLKQIAIDKIIKSTQKKAQEVKPKEKEVEKVAGPKK